MQGWGTRVRAWSTVGSEPIGRVLEQSPAGPGQTTSPQGYTPGGVNAKFAFLDISSILPGDIAARRTIVAFHGSTARRAAHGG